MRDVLCEPLQAPMDRETVTWLRDLLKDRASEILGLKQANAELQCLILAIADGGRR